MSPAGSVTGEQKNALLSLAKDLPSLWGSPTTQDKDRKRILRLLVKDITVEKLEVKKFVLHLRWQGELEAATPRFVIESDASIVAPLMFAYVLGQ